MKLPLYIVIIIFALTFVPACRPSAFDVDVARAEALMESAPDSALSIAESLRPSGRAENARAALLLLKARYKAYVPLTDDSLARLAADYFADDDSLAVQAGFFLGDTYFNLKKYDRSLVAAKTGQDIAARIGDKYYEGLIARLQADIYNECYDFDNDVRYRRIAFQCFSEAGKYSHEIWEKLDYAEALGLADKMSESLEFLDSIVQDTVGVSTDFHNLFFTVKVMNYYLLKDYANVVATYAQKDEFGLGKNAYDWAVLGLALTHTGEYRKAVEAVDSAERLSSVKTDTIRICMAKRALALAKGDYESAYNYKLKEASTGTKYVDSLLTHPFNSLVAETYKLQADKKILESKRLRSSLYLAIAISVLSIIIVLLVCVLVKRTILLNKIKTESLVNELNSLGTKLRADLSKISQEKIDITKRRLGDMNLLCTEIFRMPSHAKETIKVLQKFDGVIEELRTREMQGYLEDYLNHLYNGVMQFLHSEHPSLSEKQVTLFIFCAIGFSPEAVALMTSSASLNGLSSSKSRLKRVFLEADTEHTKLFVSMLSMNRRSGVVTRDE